MGIVFGLLTALCFAASAILARIGQRHRLDDDGLFMTVLVNVLTLGVVALFAIAPLWNTAGIVALMAGGVMGAVGGRATNLRAVRLIGPSRASAFITGTPVVAAVSGWIVLGEALTPVEALGGAIVIGGLLWLIKARSSITVAAREAVPPPLSHYLIAAVAPLFFGLAFVARKWGLARYDSTIIGAFIGAAAAFVVVILIDMLRGKLRERVGMNLREVPWWFVGAGIAMTLALLSQFTAFTYLPAWVVGILQSTQGIWVIGLSLLFLRGEERIDGALVGSVLLVAVGVVLISLQ